MIDRYIIGKEIGVSPEADVPLLKRTNTEDRLGGAANVCVNLIGLDLQPILIASCGADYKGSILQELCTFHGIESYFEIIENRTTTLKTRIVDDSFNQFLRFDEEETKDLNEEQIESLTKKINQLIEQDNIHAILIQDYNKGLITESLIVTIQEISKRLNIPLIVDPKHNHFLELSKCTIFKPNLKELSFALGRTIEAEANSIRNAIEELQLSQDSITIVTLAEKGIFWKFRDETGIIKGIPVDTADVSGAGDTVLSILTFGTLRNLSIHKIAEIANRSGAIVCGKPGVSQIRIDEIRAFLQ